MNMNFCHYEMLELRSEYSNGHLIGTRVLPAGLCLIPAEGNTGWCKEHAYVHEMLQAAISVGCPELVITTTYNWKTKKQEPALTVGKGLSSWEAYAPRHQKERHDSVMAMLKEIKAQQDLEAQNAIKKAVAKHVRNAA